tara:strand:- start:7478 stop:8299 length:822 start_codon:yes stop_codon:yes gene_type:complete
MKIALCLHGYFANAGGVKASIDGHKYISRKLLDKYNVDVFIHSWDLENKDTVLSLYNPTECLFEPQMQFEKELEIIKQDDFFGKNSQAPGMYSINTVFKGLSFLYSRKAAIQIKKDYEEKNNFKYDCVILARFDLGQRGKNHPQKYYATNFNFNPTLDMKYIYSAFWNQLNHGYADHWFFSNSQNMDKLSLLFDMVKEYYQLDSKYVKSVTSGWPDSNSYNEFSNEFFLTKKSLTLKKFPLWACIDNHKLYKWYFIDTGLYNKSKFIDITEDR